MIKKLLMKKKVNKNGNAGSTLVTVVVVVAFLSILATIMLYVSGQNYKTKLIDQRTKASFYEAEEVIELLKTRLVVEVAAASEPAFSRTSMDYIQSNDENIRSDIYFVHFRTEMENHWKKIWDADGDGSIEAASGISHLFPGATDITVDGSTVTFKINISGDAGDELECVLHNFKFDGCMEIPSQIYGVSDGSVPGAPATPDPDNVSRYYVRDIELTATDEDGYTSVINTSFEITPPMLNWGDTVKNQDDELDYSDCVKYYLWSKE